MARRIFRSKGEGLFRDCSKHAKCTQVRTQKNLKKRRITKSTVTPTHNFIEHSKLDTVASSARRIFSPKAILGTESKNKCMSDSQLTSSMTAVMRS